ncbi:hypothetical protein ACQ4WP_28400 [Janthinobacterium sp. GB4P2]|uniref:hypothetical protein n=1 Tax=Janthinobacterium sp. GB4P2 TaxID=3424189 RepID=UPI003F20B1F9
MFFTILLPKTLFPWLSSTANLQSRGAGIAHGLSAQVPLPCAAAIQYSAIGSIYFAVLFVSLQFIVIINCNSKYTLAQYYRQSRIACKRYPESCAADVMPIKEISAA